MWCRNSRTVFRIRWSCARNSHQSYSYTNRLRRKKIVLNFHYCPIKIGFILMFFFLDKKEPKNQESIEVVRRKTAHEPKLKKNKILLILNDKHFLVSVSHSLFFFSSLRQSTRKSCEELIIYSIVFLTTKTKSLIQKTTLINLVNWF